MKIISPNVQILSPVDGQAILKHIELCGRVCYKSEAKITDTSAATFVRGIIKRGHEAVLEHFNITVKFICDRGVSHEIVRHRMASYCQESTRYCNYSNDSFGGEITVIRPNFLVEGTEGWQYWREACLTAERRYFELLNFGCTPQEARAVLPNSLKTEVVMTANLREWRHFFKLRTAQAAHPQMREVATLLLRRMQESREAFSPVTMLMDSPEPEAVLAHKVLVQHMLGGGLRVGVDLAGQQGHLGHFFQHNGVVNSLGGILAPGKGAMAGAQNAGHMHRVRKVSIITLPVFFS